MPSVSEYFTNFAIASPRGGVTWHFYWEGRHITRRNLRFCSDCVESGKFKTSIRRKEATLRPMGVYYIPFAYLRLIAWGMQWRLYMHSVGLALLVSIDGHFPEPYTVERATIEAPRFCNMVCNINRYRLIRRIMSYYHPNEHQVLQ